MSGVIAWLIGFLDGTIGKYTFRATTFRSDAFASACWTGIREVLPTGVLAYTMPDGRLMYRTQDTRLMYVLPDGRLEYRVRAE